MEELHDLNPLYENASAIRQRMSRTLTKTKTQNPHGLASWCGTIRRGSHLGDYKTFTYDGKTSGHHVVFNLGSYKSGSTSVDAAVQRLGLRACKIGWGDLGDDDSIKDLAFRGEAVLQFDRCPVQDSNNPECEDYTGVLRKAPNVCDVVGDSPWPFNWPTVMRAYPYAKFILSRQKTCADWVYHVRGLWEAGGGVGDLTTCWFAGEHPDLWHRRCLETERVIVLTAQMLKLPLLVLHATGNRSENKMRHLARFLNIHLKDPDTKYPHVHTPSEHREYERPPPEDAPDENEDLWAGDWNGGVPYGIMERPPTQR
jgi:hypothetical protein